MANLLVVLIKNEVTRTAIGGVEKHYGYDFTVQSDLTLETIVTEAQAGLLMYAGRVKVKGETAPALAARLDVIVKKAAMDAAKVALDAANEDVVHKLATLTEATAAVVAKQVIETAADAAWDAAVIVATDADTAWDTAVSDYGTALALALSTGATVETPTVATFTVGSPTLLVVPVTAFTSTDNKAVTGWIIVEGATPPAIDAAGWLSAAPTSFTGSSAAEKVLYPWVKDASGRISAVFGSPRTVTFLGA